MHFFISSLSRQTGHIIHRELYSMGKSHPPMGISPFLKTVVLYLILWLGNLYHTVFMEEWFFTLPNAEAFFHFLISKQGWDVLGLEETGWGEETGSALWDKDEIMGRGGVDQVENQKMCWPHVVLLTRACQRECRSLRRFSSCRDYGSHFQWWRSLKVLLGK